MTAATTQHHQPQSDSSSSSQMNQNDQQQTSSSTTATPATGTGAALSGIIPAVASTMCCWGPPLWGMVGGGTAAGSVALQRFARYRPYLLGLSATMITYSFTKVYPNMLTFGKHNDNNTTTTTTQPQPSHDSTHKPCCHDKDNEKAQPHSNHHHHHNQELQWQRAVVWASLAVAIAGASYGRVKIMPTTMNASWSRPFFSSTRSPTNHNHQVPNAALPKRMQFQVTGMACQGCANKVQAALQPIPGVQNVTVDHRTGQTIVEMAAGTPITHHPENTEYNVHDDVDDDSYYKTIITAAIEKAGYRVSNIDLPPKGQPQGQST